MRSMTTGGHFAAIVLAGRRSTRFGRDKAGELLRGRSLLQRVLDRLDGIVDEYVVVKAAGQELPARSCRPSTPAAPSPMSRTCFPGPARSAASTPGSPAWLRQAP